MTGTNIPYASLLKQHCPHIHISKCKYVAYKTFVIIDKFVDNFLDVRFIDVFHSIVEE